MSNPPYPNSPIDTHSPYSLHDVLADEIPKNPDEAPGGMNHTEYLGLFVHAQGDGRYLVQPDGVRGGELIDVSEFDDVLELVDLLNNMAFFRNEEPDEEVAERFGRIMTRDEEKVNENPEIYVHVLADEPSNAPA